jgi:hypothetical protein
MSSLSKTIDKSNAVMPAPTEGREGAPTQTVAIQEVGAFQREEEKRKRRRNGPRPRLCMWVSRSCELSTQPRETTAPLEGGEIRFRCEREDSVASRCTALPDAVMRYCSLYLSMSYFSADRNK